MVDARLYKPCQFKESEINTMLMMMKMIVAAVRMMDMTRQVCLN